MGLATHIRLPFTPLSIATHQTEPLLSLGLSEGGISVVPVHNIHSDSSVNNSKNSPTKSASSPVETFITKHGVTHKIPCDQHDVVGCRATELQAVSGKAVQVYAATDSSIFVFDIEKQGENSVLQTFKLNNNVAGEDSAEASISTLRSIDAHTLLAGDDMGGIHVFDVRTSTKQAMASCCITEQADYISRIEPINMFGTKAVLCSSGDGTVCTYELRSNRKHIKLMYATDVIQDDILDFTILKNDELLVASTMSGALNLYNMRFVDRNARADIAAHMDRMIGHPESVNAVLGCGPHDGVVVTASSDGFVRVVDVVNKKLLGILEYPSIQDEDESQEDSDDLSEDENIDDDEEEEEEEENDADDDESADESDSDEEDEKLREIRGEKVAHRSVTTMRKRKRRQRWPIEAMVAVQGVGLPVFALVSHDRLVRFCDGKALQDDDSEDEGDTGKLSRDKDAVLTKMSSKTKKTLKKKRKHGDGEDEEEENNPFFNDL